MRLSGGSEMLGFSHGEKATAMATKRKMKSKRAVPKAHADPEMEGSARGLVILTGLSGAGKASGLKAFEDLGYYSVDNWPLELIPRFAELVEEVRGDHARGAGDRRARGIRLDRFPAILKQVRKVWTTRVVFLEANEEARA